MEGGCGLVRVAAGFIKSPLSQKRLAQDSVELYCEAIGNPIPEIQWWFEGNDPNETHAQLWDGARQDRVKINATYNLHSTSTISIANLTADDSGMYECRASNDPDRNHLSKSPKVKWIRSQANVFVIEREWPHAEALALCSDTGVSSSPAVLTPVLTRVLKALPTLPPRL
ncbi:basigin-like [Ammospiza maritima maritima]